MKQSPPALAHLAGALSDLGRRSLRRGTAAFEETSSSYCSNDYLGLAGRVATGPGGAGASRLVAGDRPAHRALEQSVAEWLGAEACLVFTSGYAANVGTVSSLARKGDLLVSDERNHASIIDGARLSQARIVVTPHLDVDAVRCSLRERQERRAWVVTESYFSMDADSPDLRALRSVCDEFGAALIVDEAHAFGVLGPDGAGLCADAGVMAEVRIGTFGKALGAGGAFVVGCHSLIEWLWNTARSFVFSTGLSPVVASAARANLRFACEHPELRAEALSMAQRLRDGLMSRGLSLRGYGHVVPWILGSVASALEVSSRLAEKGIRVPAIRFPSVPLDAARLRLTGSAAHTRDETDRFIAIVGGVACPRL